MISKPEPRDHVENGAQSFILRANIPVGENKRSSLPNVAPQTRGSAPKLETRKESRQVKSNIPKTGKQQTTTEDKKSSLPRLDEAEKARKSDVSLKNPQVEPKKEESVKPLHKDTQVADKRDHINPAKKDPLVEEHTVTKKTNIPEKPSKNDITKNNDVKKSDVSSPSEGGVSDKNNNNNTDKKSAVKCPHQCASACAPQCDKPCCNRQIVYEAFHKPQKRSKVKFQLEMLK